MLTMLAALATMQSDPALEARIDSVLGGWPWYDAWERKWVVDSGTSRLRIGNSSRKLPLTTSVKVP